MVGTRLSAGLCNVYLLTSAGQLLTVDPAGTGVYTNVFISRQKNKHLRDTFLTEMHIFTAFQVQMSVYFLGHVFFIVAFLSEPYLRKTFVPKKERGQSKLD